LLELRHRADSQIFWLLVAQWAVILSASIAMATRWQSARLDSLSSAVIWVGSLSFLPLVMVLRSPGNRWSRWTVVVSQGVMSSLLWYVSGGRPEAHLQLFAWLVVVALYRDVFVLLATAAAALVGDAVVLGCCTLPTLSTGGTAQWVTHLAWLACLFAETSFLIAFVLLDRQSLATLAKRAVTLETVQSECRATVEEMTRTHAWEQEQSKGEVASLTQRRAAAEAARFETMRELLSLRREVGAHAAWILKLFGTSDSPRTLESRAQSDALREQAEHLRQLVDLPPGDSPDQSPEISPDANTIPLDDPASKAGKRAMLMIRNPLQQAMAVTALESEEFTVDVVPNGPRAYYSVMLNDYSAIIVDIDLPGEEGFDTIEALRLLPPDRVAETNCLFALTTALTPERVLRCTDLKVDGMFVKPLKAETLHQTLTGSSAVPVSVLAPNGRDES
jgi:CheY-like chemotaxis protein